ncbi:MAG: hypothetical protein AAF465_05530 [Pseudomonadota bacterium]
MKVTPDTFRYTDLLLMPLRGTLLVNALGISALYVIATMGWLLGLLLKALVVVATVRYAQIIVEKLAHGQTDIPPLSPHDFNLFHNFGAMGFYATLIILTLLGAAVEYRLGDGAVAVYTLLVVLMLPAMLAASVLENSLQSALNPVAISRIILAIGWRYLGVCAIVILGYLVSSLVAGLVGGLVISTFASVYAIFLLSCAVGMLVFASRHELGLNVESPQERRDRDIERDARIRDGDALQVAQQTARLSSQESALELWRYHERNGTSADRRMAAQNALRVWPDPLTALRFAQPLCAWLVKEGQLDTALDVARWSITTEPAFRLTDAHTAFALGQLATRTGQFKLAALLMQDIGARHPEFPEATYALFMVARNASEKLGSAPLLKSSLVQLHKLGVRRDDARLQSLIQALHELQQGSPSNAATPPADRKR